MRPTGFPFSSITTIDAPRLFENSSITSSRGESIFTAVGYGGPIKVLNASPGLAATSSII